MSDQIQLTSTADIKVPTNLQMEIPVLSKAERAKEFRQELMKIEASRLEAMNQPNESINSETNNEEVKHAETEANNSIVDSDSNNSNLSDLTDVSGANVDGNNELDNKPIPKKRLDKEVSKRKELELRLQEERDARIKAETEMNVYTDAMKKLNKQSEVESIPEIDPLDSEAHRFYMDKISKLEKTLNERTESLAQNSMHNKFEQVVNNQANEYIRKNPDFNEAYKYVLNREKDAAKLIGIPENQLDSFVMQKLQPIAMQIYNNGGDVADTMYKMAKNYGYQSKQSGSKPSGVNLKAIEKNASKSSSIIDDVPASSVGIQGDHSALVKLDRFSDAMMSETGHGVDPAKFRKLLNAIANG